MPIRFGGRGLSARSPQSKSLTVYRWFYGAADDATEDAAKAAAWQWAEYTSDQMRSLAPKRSGKLARSFHPRLRPSRRGAGWTASVYTTRPNHARWVNYGTGIYNTDPAGGHKGYIYPTRATVLRWPGRPVRRGQGPWRGIQNTAGIIYNFAARIRGQKPTKFMERAEAEGARMWERQFKPQLQRALSKITKGGFK